ncbi:hypothetical protein QFC21_002831 [Naganishia friedmannii]|uniref:Uncharacterized protein n=1 Tax=Naganishia friedmannii TaxID=89922 RepID=A0ACC2VV31_9TREE|nr:hypothetical protein QFC21_002831 [Naganishia friedmannii]
MESCLSDDQTTGWADICSGTVVSAVGVLPRENDHLTTAIETPSYLKSDQHRSRQSTESIPRTQEGPRDPTNPVCGRASDAHYSNDWPNIRYGRVDADKVGGYATLPGTAKHQEEQASDVATSEGLRSAGKRPDAQVDDHTVNGESRNLRRSTRTRKPPVRQQQLVQPIQKRTRPEKKTHADTPRSVSRSSQQSVPTIPQLGRSTINFSAAGGIAVRASKYQAPYWRKRDNTGDWTDEQNALMSNLLKQQMELNCRPQSTSTDVVTQAVPNKSLWSSQSPKYQLSHPRQPHEIWLTKSLPPPVEQKVHVQETILEQSAQHHEAILRQTQQMCEIQSILPTIGQETRVQETKANDNSILTVSRPREEAYQPTSERYDAMAITDVFPPNQHHAFANQHHSYETSPQAQLKGTNEMFMTNAHKANIDPTLMILGPTYQIDMSPDRRQNPRLDQMNIQQQHLLDHYQRYGDPLNVVHSDYHQLPVQEMMIGAEPGLVPLDLINLPFSTGSHQQETHRGSSQEMYFPYAALLEPRKNIDGKHA